MSPLDYTDPLNQVRLLISDVGGDSGTDLIFTDPEIQAFLAMRSQNVRYAAATALRAIAGNSAQVLKVIKFLDLETSGDKVAASLMALADRYEKEADDDAPFEIAHIAVTDFARRYERHLED